MKKLILLVFVSLLLLSVVSGEVLLPNNEKIPSGLFVGDLVSSGTSYDYEYLGVYDAFFLSDPTTGDSVFFSVAGHDIRFQPHSMNWNNDLGQLQQVSMPQSVVGFPDGLVMRYPDAYGAGVDLEYELGLLRMKEKIVIDSLSSLVSPQQYVLDGGNAYLEVNFNFATDTKLFVDGVEWDMSTAVVTGGDVFIRDEDDNLLYVMNTPFAVDSVGNRLDGFLSFKKSGNSLYVGIEGITYDWLQSAVFPVVIDPTLTVDYTPHPAELFVDGVVTGDEVLFGNFSDVTVVVSDNNDSTFVTVNQFYSLDAGNFTAVYIDKGDDYSSEMQVQDGVVSAELNVDSESKSINITLTSGVFSNGCYLYMNASKGDGEDNRVYIHNEDASVIYGWFDPVPLKDVYYGMTSTVLENISGGTDFVYLSDYDGGGATKLEVDNIDVTCPSVNGSVLTGHWNETYDSGYSWFLRVRKLVPDTVVARVHTWVNETSVNETFFVEQTLFGTGWFNIPVDNLMNYSTTVLGLNATVLRFYTLGESSIAEVNLRKESGNDTVAPNITDCRIHDSLNRSINVSSVYDLDTFKISCLVTDDTEVNNVTGYVNGEFVHFSQCILLNGWYYEVSHDAVGDDIIYSWNNVTARDVVGNGAVEVIDEVVLGVRHCDYKGSGLWSIFRHFFCRISSAFSDAGERVVVSNGNTTVVGFDVDNFSNLSVSDNSTFRVVNGSVVRLG